MMLKRSFPMFLMFFLACMSGQSFAMGQKAQLFENPTEAYIWDHGRSFFLRMDLTDLGDLKDQKAVWAGFEAEAGSDDSFHGRVKTENFGVQEQSFPARAKLVAESASGRYFLIQVLGEQGQLIKEFLVKGPPHR